MGGQSSRVLDWRMAKKKYRKRPDAPIVAVRLALDTSGFEYRKWDGIQRCKAGDWVVDNNGDCYTIDADTFAATYERVAPGQYVKSAPVWAEQATTAGMVATKEGSTSYEPGDYIVANNPDGTDSWAVGREKFEAMYVSDSA